MDVVVSRCAGIDIEKAEVVVRLRIPGSRGKRVSQVRTFSAVAGEMNRLADWLAEHQVSHVVMEARRRPPGQPPGRGLPGVDSIVGGGLRPSRCSLAKLCRTLGERLNLNCLALQSV
jgi:hypothetical protein